MDIFSCCEINTSQFVGHLLAAMSQQANEIKKNASEEYLFKLLDLVKIYNERYSSLLNDFH